jgi:hypothetical protein
MWFWCNSPFAVMWWIFPIIFLICLVMTFFCMRRFFGGHIGCCSPRSNGRKGAGENVKPHNGAEERGTDSRKEER